MAEKKKKIFLILGITIVFLIIGIIAYFCLFEDVTTADWVMYGYEISADREVLQTMEFTLNAQLTERTIGDHSLKLAISSFPQGMGYYLFDREDYYRPGESNAPQNHYPFSFYYYDEEQKCVLSDAGILNLEERAIIFRIGSASRYLVASADPDADPPILLEHFSDFTGMESNKVTPVDWTMHGILMTAAGEAVENVEFSVQGQIMDMADDMDTLDICGVFPDDFRFDLPATEPAYYSMAGKMLGTEYFVCDGYSFDYTERHSTPCTFALSLEKETMVIYWQKENMYLVASQNADINTDDIISYYTGENL